MYSFVDVKIGDDFVEIPKGGRLLGVDVDHPGIIPFRCKQGICGTCRIEVVYGQENVSPPNPAESKFLDRSGHFMVSISDHKYGGMTRAGVT